jgi:starvation-inducible outer membrane lipoprotein
MTTWHFHALLLTLFLAGCTSYPPALAPSRGQTAAQQEADAKDCDHQVHSAGRSMVVGMFTAWSTEERDKYVACMQGKGYMPAK